MLFKITIPFYKSTIFDWEKDELRYGTVPYSTVGIKKASNRQNMDVIGNVPFYLIWELSSPSHMSSVQIPHSIEKSSVFVAGLEFFIYKRCSFSVRVALFYHLPHQGSGLGSHSLRSVKLKERYSIINYTVGYQ